MNDKPSRLSFTVVGVLFALGAATSMNEVVPYGAVIVMVVSGFFPLFWVTVEADRRKNKMFDHLDGSHEYTHMLPHEQANFSSLTSPKHWNGNS
jgi:hypothetical protein